MACRLLCTLSSSLERQQPRVGNDLVDLILRELILECGHVSPPIGDNDVEILLVVLQNVRRQVETFITCISLPAKAVSSL